MSTVSAAGDLSRPAVLDLEMLESHCRLEQRLGKPVLDEMFEIFELHMPSSCGRMEQALAEGDAATVGQLAHKLKSGARCLGFLRLGEIVAELEEVAQQGQLQGARRRLAAIANEHQRAASALQRFLADRNTAAEC